MEHRVDVNVGYSWTVQCTDTDECGQSDSWELDGGDSAWFQVYVPVFTPVHPRVARYTTVGNAAYNLLVKPAMNETLQKMGQAANFFYSQSAAQICKSIPKASD